MLSGEKSGKKPPKMVKDKDGKVSFTFGDDTKKDKKDSKQSK